MISVVIVTANRRPLELLRCLNALVNQSFKIFEVIVVLPKNANNLDVLQYSGRLKILLVNQSGRGICNARNCGIKASRGEIVAFIDDDTEAYSDWLQKINRYFVERPELDYFSGEFTLNPKNVWQHWINERYHLSKADVEHGWCHGCNMAYRRKIFDNNLFDESILFGADESEFQSRLKASGFQSAMFKDVLVKHQHRNSFLSFTKMRWGYAQGHTYLVEVKRKQSLFHWTDLLNLSFFISCAYAIFLSFSAPWLWFFPIFLFPLIMLHERKSDGSALLIVDVYVAMLWTLSKMYYSLRWHFRRWGWSSCGKPIPS